MHLTTNPSHLLTILSTILFLTCGALQQQHPDGGSCIPAERAALLSFKKGVTIDSTNRFASWHGQDCCRWRGVKCSNETGHVLELRLRNEKTNLHAVASFLGSMENLRYLNLSFIPSFGPVPPHLGNLSSLQYLDLGSNDLYSKIYSTDITWLKNLHLLQHLSMRRVNLSQIADWPQILNEIPSLRVIDLRDCKLDSANQTLPYINLTKLENLDLSWNNFTHEIASCWFWKATGLKYLDLSGHGFFGEFHDALENMESLQVLDLSFGLHNNLVINNLVMKGNFKNVCSLEILDLSSNGINGDIYELMERFPQCTWDKLQELHLDDNNFTGTLPNLTVCFTNLIILDISAKLPTTSLEVSHQRSGIYVA